MLWAIKSQFPARPGHFLVGQNSLLFGQLMVLVTLSPHFAHHKSHAALLECSNPLLAYNPFGQTPPPPQILARILLAPKDSYMCGN